jgi:hypothetical protein
VIDLPPEQVIEQRLVQCGLNPSGFSVKYEDYLQSIEIVIKAEAEATPEQFGCIKEVADLGIISFTDLQMNKDYRDYVTGLLRPKMLESSRQSLEKIGKLKNFPERADFVSNKLFAEAIEVHCDVPMGGVLKEFGDRIAFMPQQEEYRDFDRFTAKYSCLINAIAYVAAKRELDIGFIGNGAIDGKEQK